MVIMDLKIFKNRIAGSKIKNYGHLILPFVLIAKYINYFTIFLYKIEFGLNRVIFNQKI